MTVADPAEGAGEGGDARRRRVLEAALAAFGLYGFRRTSMADIAKAAGTSRPALYLLFRNKEDIFRSLSEALQAQANQAAAEGLRSGGPFEQRLAAGMLGRERVLLDILADSPHAAELLDVNDSVADDVTRAATARFRAQIAAAVAAAAETGEILLEPLGLTADRVAEILVTCLSGMKQPSEPRAATEARIRDLVTLAAAALRPDCGTNPVNPGENPTVRSRRGDNDSIDSVKGNGTSD